MDRDADRHGPDLGEGRGDVVAQVGFGEHDRRARAALPGQHEIALQAAGAEVVDEGADDEDDVHVGGHDLLHGAPVLVRRRLAHEDGPARKYRVDDRPLCAGLGPQSDPVADCRQVERRERRVAKPAGHLGRDHLKRPWLSACHSDCPCDCHPDRPGIDIVGAPVLDRDAAGAEPLLGEGQERLVEVGAPAELGRGEAIG